MLWECENILSDYIICFIPFAVVIKKALRGKGFGRILMEKTEHLAKG